jgi:hypothetical protein
MKKLFIYIKIKKKCLFFSNKIYFYFRDFSKDIFILSANNNNNLNLVKKRKKINGS